MLHPLFDFSRVFMIADIASVPEGFLAFCCRVALNLNQINPSPNHKNRLQMLIFSSNDVFWKKQLLYLVDES